MSALITIQSTYEKSTILTQEAQTSLIDVQTTQKKPNLVAKWILNEQSQLQCQWVIE